MLGPSSRDTSEGVSTGWPNNYASYSHGPNPTKQILLIGNSRCNSLRSVHEDVAEDEADSTLSMAVVLGSLIRP